MSIHDDLQSSNPQTVAQYAAEYRRLGLQTIPCHNKVPAVPWKEFQDTLMPQGVFDGLYGPAGRFAGRPDMGIGLVMGAASGGKIALDLDSGKPGQKAENWYQGALEVHNCGFALDTWEQRTGGGGRHLFFQCPEGWATGNATTDLDVDVRGQGGYAVVPPSPHPSGGVYSWLPGRAPWEIAIMQAPQWLLDEIERLVLEHGGGSISRIEAGERPVFDGFQRTSFGTITDGREKYMRDLLWAALTGYRVEGPITPGKVEADATYLDYSRNVAVREPLPDESHEDGLEREGRGYSAFMEKWNYAIKQHWHGKLKDAAEVRKARGVKSPQLDPQPEPKIDPKTGEPLPLVLSEEQFMRGFIPPDYQIEGMLQKSYLYALTARTGHGKTAVAMLMASCVARGVPFHGHPTAQGRVLFLAGENSQDVRARYKVLADHERFAAGDIPIYFIDGVIDIAASMPRIRDEIAKIGDLALVVIDTATAYFKGDDVNNNTQQGLFAQLLRQFVRLPGAPAVVVNCHPVKNANQDNLVPLGGSNFLNEIDGNFTLWAEDKTCALNPHPAKWRGAPFEQIEFELRVVVSDTVKDSKGRHMPSVVAVPITEQGAERRGAVAEADDITVLGLIHTHKTASMSELAKKAGFVLPNGQPYKSKVQRVIERLKASKLVYKYHGSKYRLTKKGGKVAGVKLGEDDGDAE